MHASEAAAPHHHSRHDPVKSSANGSQTESQDATPQFHVPASAISSPVLPDTNAGNVAPADTTHENITSNSRHLPSYGSRETTNASAVGSKLERDQHCIDSDKFGIGDHLEVPITPKRRHDSFHKSPVSNNGDGDCDGDGDDDSLLELLTPLDPGSRPLSRNQGTRADSGSLDWTSHNQWQTGTTPSSSFLNEAWTTVGAIEPSDSDEPKYDEVKPIVSVSAAQSFQH